MSSVKAGADIVLGKLDESIEPIPVNAYGNQNCQQKIIFYQKLYQRIKGCIFCARA